VKNELFLYVPTYRRTQRPLTLLAIPRKWQERTVIVCPPDEVEFYSKTKPFYYMKTIGLSTKRAKNIAQKRKWIFEHTPYSKIMMLDDDLKFFVRKRPPAAFGGFEKRPSAMDWGAYSAVYPDSAKLIPAEGLNLSDVFMNIQSMLDTYAHGGISQRFMNQNFGQEWRHTCKATHAIAFRPKIVRDHCELGRVSMFEDLDYTLQLMKAGFDNAVLNWAATNDPYGFNAPGGESEDRKVEDIDRGADRMAQLHPGIVSVVERTDAKADVQGHKRIIVQWAKALRTGQATKEFI
jgi:hypothetical protein